jgi:hypothetical protein
MSTFGIRAGKLIAEGGPMMEPLREQTMFQKAFVMMGVLSWPNGFDLDAIQLHRDMRHAGELYRRPKFPTDGATDRAWRPAPRDHLEVPLRGSGVGTRNQR